MKTRIYFRNISRSVYAVLAFFASLSVVSCSDYEEESQSFGDNIHFIIDDDTQTRAGEADVPRCTDVNHYKLSSPDGSLYVMEVSDFNSFFDNSSEEQVITRSTPIETVAGLGDFSTYCYHANGSVYYENVRVGNDGILKQRQRWPQGESLRFYAIHPYDATSSNFTSSATAFKCNHTVSTSVSSQKDLMYASTGLVAFNTNHVAPLKFHHALTAVKINVGNLSSNITKITSIKLKNVYTTGTYTLPTNSTGKGSWSNLGSQKDITLSGSWTTLTAGKEIVTGANTFLMIPQSLSNISLEIAVTYKDGSTGTLKWPLSSGTAWAQGKTRVYKISSSSTTMSVTYPTSWADAGNSNAAVQGPVTAYTAGESFGLFAVDANNNVKLSNIQVTAKSAGSTSALTLPSSNFYNVEYTYFLYYPYRSSISIGTPSGYSTADQFFSNVIANWTVSTTQNTLSLLKAQDLQIAKLASNKFTMVHKMGLAKVTRGSASRPNTLTWNFTAPQTSHTAYSSSTSNNASYTASASLNTATSSRVYNSNGYWTIVKATGTSANTSVTLASVANVTTKVANSTDSNNGWSTTISNIGYGKYRSITVTPTHVPLNFVANFPYNSSKTYYQITLPRVGRYYLDVYGAESSMTANGGRSYGYYNYSSGTLYVCCGGGGSLNSGGVSYGTTGGYNGGGHGVIGGSGATHIATALRGNGQLSNYSSYRGDVLLVAGGGGAYDNVGSPGLGAGGNTAGGNGMYNGSVVASGGGTGGAGSVGYGIGSFGQGGSSYPSTTGDSGPGGGGGWFGGNSPNIVNGGWQGGAGGGSGYINTSKISSGGGTSGTSTGNGHVQIKSQF